MPLRGSSMYKIISVKGYSFLEITYVRVGFYLKHYQHELNISSKKKMCIKGSYA